MITPATALPWIVRSDETAWANWISSADKFADIAEIGEGWPVSEKSAAEQDAAYIVHACNTYPALLAMAQRLAAFLEISAGIIAQQKNLLWPGLDSADATIADFKREFGK